MPDPSQDITVRVGRNVISGVPKISVVIPAYNSAATIEETLASAIAQKYREHEIILVNDGSPDTDQLERAIRTRLEDIVYIKQPNKGAGPARNTAIEHARGHLIAFLDADDIWEPQYLASQFVHLNRSSLDMVYCDAWLFGGGSAYRRTFMEGAPSVGECTFNAILDLKCNVITSGTIVKKEAVIAVGLFETERVRAHDFHLWLRIAGAGYKIGYQRKQLLKYRVETTGLSGDAISRVERELDAFRRVADTIVLGDKQLEIVARRIRGLEADLAVEQGKSFLLAGDYPEAALAFRVANRHRRSIKLSFITWLASHAPNMLAKRFRTHRRDEIALIRKQA
jgi:glycosyltransferase involved in cell wall biosynthesis